MSDALWSLTAYTIQLAAVVAVAMSAAWALGIRIPRHALAFWHTVMAIALLLPLAQPPAGDASALLVLVRSTAAAAIPDGARPLVPGGLAPETFVLLIVGAGIAARLLWLGVGLVRLRTIVARATTEPSLALIGDELARTLGVDAAITVSDDLEGPATVGVTRPLVLVPRRVLQMPPAVQRAIICHELVHVKRRDWLHTIAEEVWRSLLWFHPFARVIAARLSLAREMVVDETTIRMTRDRRAYAEALLAFSDPQPHVIGVTPFIGRRTLSQRIALIAEEASMFTSPGSRAGGVLARGHAGGHRGSGRSRSDVRRSCRAAGRLQTGQRGQPAGGRQASETRLYPGGHAAEDPGKRLAIVRRQRDR